MTEMDGADNRSDQSQDLNSLEQNPSTVTDPDVAAEPPEDKSSIDEHSNPTEKDESEKDNNNTSDEEVEELIKPSRPTVIVDSDDEDLDDEDLDLIQENLGLKSRVEVSLPLLFFENP
jgi:hypothetical protein